ncbi:hypothetical protein QQS21_004138 [Conoideocrella luteorostrata]|uniref:FAD-binding domain-containing protein n=1 Tax=Conoideocrella luteorostrata TaxID=1105319 RepID=A0AAJ0CUX2_9HYPO|nr:hypothetical protein QQS21_004138 [Conoideocrella luteorostrata]
MSLLPALQREMGLNIIVVGAGIGGLCSAVALQQAGHNVKVFEKSEFNREVGAALLLAPNAERVLLSLGFDFQRARADEMNCWEVLDGVTLQALSKTDFSDSREKYGASLHSIHRADLHQELLHLASRPAGPESSGRLSLHLASRVVSAHWDGYVDLEDGTRHHADLVVAADGLHSVIRSVVTGDQRQDGMCATPSGMSAFRFLIPTDLLKNNPHFQSLRKIKGPGSTIFADTKHVTERHMVWYDCQQGQVQNFVGVRTTSEAGDHDLKALMRSEFEDFHPSLLQLIQVAPKVTDWPLYIYDPLPVWSKGKIILVGDAAHPMLPFGGQGANQAIEDAGALGALFAGVSSPSLVSERLKLFEDVRRLRASRVQILSKARLGKEKEVEAELMQYADPPGANVPTSIHERYEHDFAFDVLERCREVLA